MIDAAEPHHGFDDSRRLTGPSRWYAGTAVTLTAAGPAAHEPAAHARWAARVQAMCARLGWPDPQPHMHADPHEPLLQFSAPDDRLFTATEVNEWAWERASADVGQPLDAAGYDLAQDLSDDDAAEVFAARARAESRPPAHTALQREAATRGLPLLVDDETLSVGAGSGSSPAWPLSALPDVADVRWPLLHDVPTALVTGSNGKTTTVRLLAAMARAAGRRAGVCSTEGVVVDGRLQHGGDYSGPAGARAVLRHHEVDVAILETARGGLMRRGLAVARADAAVVTNVSADHLGEYGVAGVADIAEVKLVVARALAHEGTLVLNGADAVLMATAHALPHVQSLLAQGRVALFASDHDHPVLVAHRSRGGSTCGVHGGHLLWAQAGQTQTGHTQDLGEIRSMPLTLGGAAVHNVENIAAAVLVAGALQLPAAALSRTLQQFGIDPLDNPGRLERWQHHGATVLIDYAHNPDGLAQLLRVARALQPLRLGLLLGQAGNRDDAAIIELARTAAAAAPRRIVIKELPAMRRGRPPGEVPLLLAQGLHAAGYPSTWLERIDDEAAAACSLLAWAQPGDVVVLPVHTAAVRADLVALLRRA